MSKQTTPPDWAALRHRLDEAPPGDLYPPLSSRFTARALLDLHDRLGALERFAGPDGDLDERVTSLHKWAGPLGELSERIRTLARFRR